MDNIVISKTPCNMSNGVCFADMAEEFVPEPLSIGGASNEACDIYELDHGGDGALRIDDLREYGESWIGNRCYPRIRVDRGERIVLSWDLATGERVEQRRLTDVRQPNDAAGDSHG